MAGQGVPSMLKHRAPGPGVGCPAHLEVGFLPEPMTRGAGPRGAAGGELRVRDDLRVGV